MTTLKRTALALCVAAAWPAVHAGVFAETEPNDTFAGAQVINDPGAAQTVILGDRTFANPSDDFFRFFVAAPTFLQITSTSASLVADSIMGLYGPGGNLLASNDDAGPGTSMSAISFLAPVAGLYTLGFSGFNAGLLSCTATVTQCYDTNNDFVFDTFVPGGGAGGSTGWNYAITVAVPEPETYLLFGMGLALAPWLRRRAAANRQAKGGAL